MLQLEENKDQILTQTCGQLRAKERQVETR